MKLPQAACRQVVAWEATPLELSAPEGGEPADAWRSETGLTGMCPTRSRGGVRTNTHSYRAYGGGPGDYRKYHHSQNN